jgi:hypothetical protein
MYSRLAPIVAVETPNVIQVCVFLLLLPPLCVDSRSSSVLCMLSVRRQVLFEVSGKTEDGGEFIYEAYVARHTAHPRARARFCVVRSRLAN